MSFDIKFPFDTVSNYIFDPAKIELVGGLARLIAVAANPTADFYAKMDEGKGEAVLDSSGNANHGALRGTFSTDSWVSGKFNTAIEGDGISSTSGGIVTFGNINNFATTTQFSVECWLKFTSTQSQAIVSKQSNVGTFTGYAITTVTGQLQCVVRDNLGNALAKRTTPTFNDGTFHHVVFTYDGTGTIGGFKFYVDNVEITDVVISTPLTGSIQTTIDFQLFGKDFFNAVARPGTVIDEVVVYQRVLTPADISFRWNSGAGTQSLPGLTTSFPTDNPDIVTFSNILMKELLLFEADTTVSGSDEVRFAMIINGQDTWWDGVEWLSSTGYTETNTVAEIQANLATLLPVPNPVNFKAYLHSDDGITTPELLEVRMQFDPSGTIAVTPNECTVFGYVYDNQGEPVEGVVVSAKLLNNPLYDQSIQMTRNQYSVTTNSAGYWEMSLVENDNMPEGSGYIFCFKGSDINFSDRKKVPDQLSKNYAELIDV